MFRLLVAIMTSIAFASVAVAEDCGGEDAPCDIGDGVYHFVAPDAADGAPPAVVFLHGFGGTGKGIIRNKGLVGALTARGYAVIAPQGLPFREGMRGGSWNSYLRESRRDDVAFIEAVATDAAERHGVVRDRILIGGFSGGGMMTWRIACDAPDSFAAYAPIAGLLWRPLPDACAGPFRMQHTHGWSDEVVPIEGRTVGGGILTQGDLFAGLDLLRDALRCAKDDPDGYGAEDAYQIRRWTDCAPGAELEMALHPGGHSIPKGWTERALDWFEAGLATE